LGIIRHPSTDSLTTAVVLSDPPTTATIPLTLSEHPVSLPIPLDQLETGMVPLDSVEIEHIEADGTPAKVTIFGQRSWLSVECSNLWANGSYLCPMQAVIRIRYLWASWSRPIIKNIM
jgi:hypothetical protein